MNEIKEINLSQIIQEHGVELTKRGSRFVGRCPFHNEKTGSFFVYPDNRFHCFGCGSHGDSADFIMKSYGCSFPEALERLGIRKTGKPYSKEESRMIAENKKKRLLIDFFRAWEARYSSKLGKLINKGHKVLSKVKNEDDLTRAAWIYPLLSRWEYHLNILCYGSDKDKYKLSKEVN